jgi:hypothetical protein
MTEHPSGTMSSPFLRPANVNQQRLGQARHPVTITCLQWDCDGALNDEEREWMLQKLSSQESVSALVTPWLHRHGL